MTLTDTGPLVALINRNDQNNERCVEATKRLPSGPLLTTWPCFTEAMYLLYRMGGHPAQAALWLLWEAGRLRLHDTSEAEMDRMTAFMAKYSDLPMDLADASIMAVAERLGTRRVFTLDRDFHVFRFADGSVVDIIP